MGNIRVGQRVLDIGAGVEGIVMDVWMADDGKWWATIQPASNRRSGCVPITELEVVNRSGPSRHLRDVSADRGTDGS